VSPSSSSRGAGTRGSVRCTGSGTPSSTVTRDRSSSSRDNRFYLEWDHISADRDRFDAWLDRHVLGTTDHAGYLALVREGSVG
jgi:glutaconate CoA-transferase subunit A